MSSRATMHATGQSIISQQPIQRRYNHNPPSLSNYASMPFNEMRTSLNNNYSNNSYHSAHYSAPGLSIAVSLNNPSNIHLSQSSSPSSSDLLADAFHHIHQVRNNHSNNSSNHLNSINQLRQINQERHNRRINSFRPSNGTRDNSHTSLVNINLGAHNHLHSHMINQAQQQIMHTLFHQSSGDNQRGFHNEININAPAHFANSIYLDSSRGENFEIPLDYDTLSRLDERVEKKGISKIVRKKLLSQNQSYAGRAQCKQSCSVCLVDYEAGCQLITLKCKHVYHSQCILKWLEKNSSCCECRNEVN
jgi:hypothetical protein